MKFLVSAAAAVAVHLLVGWWATPFVALAAGAWQGRGGWWMGLAVLVAAWGALVAYTAFAGAGGLGRMSAAMGAVLGVPAVLVPVATLVIAALLGAVGGLAGAGLRGLVRA